MWTAYGPKVCLLGLDQNIRLFEYSFGGLAFDFQIWDSNFEYPFFFFLTPGIPREMVLNLSAWLNICTSNRPFANERCSCWPIACIYFMKKSSISYKRACRTSTFEIMNLSTQKTRHVNGPSATTNRMRCMRFLSVNCPEMRAKVLDQHAVALVVQTRCADVKPLWESERENLWGAPPPGAQTDSY